MKATLSILGGLFLATVSLNAQPQPGIDRIIPTVEQLGAGWHSNTIAALVDPLSSPSEVAAREWEGMLNNVRKMVKAQECEAHAMIRYVYGSSNVWIWVWINRFKSKEEIPPDWGTDKQTKVNLANLPRIGDEVRFSQRDGLHDDFSFRRGNYLVTVEAGMNGPIEALKQLAKALDDNLVKAQKALAPPGKTPAQRPNNAILIAPEETNISGRDAQNKAPGIGINVNSIPQGSLRK